MSGFARWWEPCNEPRCGRTAVVRGRCAWHDLVAQRRPSLMYARRKADMIAAKRAMVEALT